MTEPVCTSIMGVHASYAISKKSKRSDMVLVKEYRDFDNGTTKKTLKFYKDFKRSFYLTKPSYRNHKSKKEWESIKHLDRYRTTQAEMIPKIARALNSRENSLRRLARNPYLYGADVDVTTIILHRYIESFGQGKHLPDIGVMDYEWDIETKSPTMGQYCYNDEIYLTVREDYIKQSGYHDVNVFKQKLIQGFHDKVQPIYDDYYARNPKVQPQRKFKIHVDVVQLDLDIVRKLFRYTHETMPDYLTFWNGISDLEIIMALCDKYSVDPSDFMNDPSIPDEYRYTELVKGLTETIDANGNPKSKKNSEQWHVLKNMASWQFIDIMCCYHNSRAHKADLPSYAFDFVIPLELGFGKLRLVPEMDGVEDVDIIRWHNVMSKKHYLEYCLYGIGDVVGPRILEDKNYEIAGQAYPSLTYNPITDFKKNPRLLCNDLHFVCLKQGNVVGTTSDRMREPVDDRIYAADNWIITLNSSYHDTMTTRALSDSYLPTLYMPACADSDLTSSYPTNQRILNIARCTTVTEIIKVQSMPEYVMRELGMDLSSGRDNSIDFCCRAFNMPHLEGVLAIYDSVKKAA